MKNLKEHDDEKGDMGMRKFKKVTKVELVLGAVASLMTGIVVGIFMYEKKKRPTLKQRMQQKQQEHAELEQASFVSAVRDGGMMARRRLMQERSLQGRQQYRTPYDLGGRPRSNANIHYADVNRRTGTRGK